MKQLIEELQGLYEEAAKKYEIVDEPDFFTEFETLVRNKWPRIHAALMEAYEPKADFLWPNVEVDEVSAAGYEFANALTEEYRKVMWDALVERIEHRALNSYKEKVQE